MKKNSFCTLFDSFYLSRGLALYRSLEEQCEDFELYILAFDQQAFDILNDLNLAKAIVISLAQVENTELLSVRSGRTRAEYCWTHTPQIIDYVFLNYNVSMCTYLDADIYFFNSPDDLLEEIEYEDSRDVLLTAHNYHPEYDQTHVSGKYCVQFVTFKNNENGRAILTWWKESCIDWCFSRLEDGKFGDQKYLESFEIYYENVHETKQLGAGLAPWNIKRFKIEFGQVREDESLYKILFYHYQALKVSCDYEVLATSLTVGEAAINDFYIPYVREIKNVNEMLMDKYDFESGLIDSISFKLKLESVFRYLKYDVILAVNAYAFNSLEKLEFRVKRLVKLVKVYSINNFKLSDVDK